MVCILTEPITYSKTDGMYSNWTYSKPDGMYSNWTNYIQQNWWYVFLLTWLRIESTMAFILTYSWWYVLYLCQLHSKLWWYVSKPNQFPRTNLVVCILTDPISNEYPNDIYSNWINYVQQNSWYVFLQTQLKKLLTLPRTWVKHGFVSHYIFPLYCLFCDLRLLI